MAQSILVQNIENYKHQFEEDVLCSAQNIILNTDYGIGEEKNLDRIGHTLLFSGVFNTNNCDLKDYINKKIYGEELDCNLNQQPILDFICNKEQYTDCNANQVIEDACDWKKIEW